MAKQSGIHQLRGKVGEHSYYQQTGVNGGLVRRINQGMAERVKTDAAFANTRLNNAEFGQAGRIAKVLGQMITPKFRPMMLPFSQSKMAKIILEGIKAATGNWGERNLTSTNVPILLDALNLVRKNDPSDYGISLSYDTAEGKINVESDDINFPAKMTAIGADGVSLRVLFCAPWIGTYVQSEKKYAESFARLTMQEYSITSGDAQEFTPDFRPAPPQGWPAFRMEYVAVVVLPYRSVNGIQHILQEHCTYITLDPAQE